MDEQLPRWLAVHHEEDIETDCCHVSTAICVVAASGEGDAIDTAIALLRSKGSGYIFRPDVHVFRMDSLEHGWAFDGDEIF